ncbi:MAG: MBL fold metallo-hydrolase RNA specificity domain-containing protein [Phycisphaerae bacterium]
MKLTFLGAAQQVTGSCYLLEAAGLRVVIDCGMYQEREYLGRNWAPFPVPPGKIDHFLLTHAHLDHCGLIPKLVGEGLKCPIMTTAASRDLAEIVLRDAGQIQEEDAAYKRRRHQKEGRPGPHKEVPLYTAQDVKKTMPLFRRVQYRQQIDLSDDVRVIFHDAGHILGSAMLEISVRENGQERTIVFSGDIGQVGKPLIHDPARLARADFVVMESTYGGRRHNSDGDVETGMAEVINHVEGCGGNLIIPTFAVERAQELVYHIGNLVRAERIPAIKTYLDSPMAVDVTAVFRRHRECLDTQAVDVLLSGNRLFKYAGLTLVRDSNDSRAINKIKESCIIMAGSGMCTSGRIKHHLVRNVWRAECTILFVGYQAHGTLGRQLVDGNPHVRIHGKDHQVRARIVELGGLSGHADHDGLTGWLEAFEEVPRRIFLTHGELDAAEALAKDIRERIGWPVEIPEYQSAVELN